MTDLNGPQLLATVLQTLPSLTLSFYPFGILLRRAVEGGGFTEYPVDAAQVAEALAAKTRFDTGILTPNTICIIAEGLIRTVIEYRPPQKTALFLEGRDTPLRVPLPGLLLIRTTSGGSRQQYHLFAVHNRPLDGKGKLFLPPLPNVYGEGGICWGNVYQTRQG